MGLFGQWKVYKGISKEDGILVDEDKAFDYALQRLGKAPKEEKEDFIEWYYSGNWIKEEEIN
jgi:hypothetical protein